MLNQDIEAEAISGKNQTLAGQRLRQIVKSSASLFIKHGFLKTTVRQIARECDINLSTLYQYVESKNNILVLFLKQTSLSMTNFIDPILTTLGKIPPQETLCKAIKDYLIFLDDNQDIWVFWYQETKNLSPDQRRYLFDREEMCINMFRKILESGCKCGQFKIDDLTLTTTSIIVLSQMWCFRRWSLRKHYTLDQYTTKLTNFILAAIL